MSSAILFVIEHIYIVIAVFFVAYAVLSYFVLSQKESVINGRDEIHTCMNQVYNKETKTLQVFAGEANKSVYTKLCK
ncbi:MAG: hypothetical protein ACLFOC_11530, partial [Campylobacterales bacterium]